MKRFFILTMFGITLIFSGCSTTVTQSDTEVEQTTTRFGIVEDNYGFDVVYDRYTKVMYSVASYGSGTGQLTLLVDENGDPLLYNPEEY